MEVAIMRRGWSALEALHWLIKLALNIIKW